MINFTFVLIAKENVFYQVDKCNSVVQNVDTFSLNIIIESTDNAIKYSFYTEKYIFSSKEIGYSHAL